MSEEPTVTTDAKATGPVSRGRGFKRNRLLIPLGFAAVLIVFTMITALIESPDTDDPDYLSPEASSDIGSSILAGKLADAGVTVERFTDATQAFREAARGDATVFIPAAEYLNGDQWYELQSLRFDHSDLQIVSVLPPSNYLDSLGLWLDGGSRIATDTVPPDTAAGKCELTEAQKAGAAAVGRQRYRTSDTSTVRADVRFCYGGSLAWYGGQGFREVVLGSGDPFTDEFISQAGNEELAIGLLGRHSRVVWLDIHSLTPEPQPSFQTDPPSDDPEPSTSRPRQEIEYPGAGQASPIYDALPSWMWAGLIGILLLGVMAALWRGRRLGPPVTEPLPVTVPAAETVHGRARLYRRAHAYSETLRALRAGALHRMLPVLRLSTQATEAEIIAAASQRSGWPAEQVASVLYHFEPADEAALFTTAGALDTLVLAVENARPQGRD